MNAWIFLALGIGVGLADFLIGLSWVRSAPDRLALNPSADQAAAAARGKVGRVLMLMGPVILIAFIAIAFGAIPIGGVEPIAFN